MYNSANKKIIALLLYETFVQRNNNHNIIMITNLIDIMIIDMSNLLL